MLYFKAKFCYIIMKIKTVAKITSGAVSDDDDEQQTVSLLRRRSAVLLDDDARYAGATVDRKSLQYFNGEESDLENASHVGDSSDVESSSLDYDSIHHGADIDGNEKVTVADMNSEEDSSADDSNESDDDDASYYNQFDMNLSAFAKGTRLADTSGDEEDDGSDIEGDKEEESKDEANDDVMRGKAVQNQIKLWEIFLELRIEMQKLLNASNQLPQHDIWPQLQAEDSADEQRILPDEINAVSESCIALSDELLYLQTALEGGQLPMRVAKRPLGEVEEVIGKRFKASQSRRDDVIQKWDDKTRLSVAASSRRKGAENSPQSILSQIQYILSDRNRLLLRTRQKRNNLKVIGKSTVEEVSADKTPENEADIDKKKQAQSHSIDNEIFNDDDFYHQLLRELIEQRTNRSDDPVAMSRQWLEFQALRKQVKRTIDTRASKGRKLRYNVMPKLVNFMAPIISSMEWDDDRKDQLFTSLFDQKPEHKPMESVKPSDIDIFR
ncbi:AATF [Bugula neritina]|uniref:AATF n=1 Tax=Bugula neritina TaxID=10212 RepID=A0A7J7KLB7_BUGNE|nr:AATF [Bugula neritina]